MPEQFEPLKAGEQQLHGATEMVWRQCAPPFLDKRTGLPTDLMFRANASDAGMMSGNRQTKCTAEGAFIHRTVIEKKLSEGTWGVSVAEIEDAGARAVDDSANQTPPPPAPSPGHTFIDVRHLEDLDKLERQRFRSKLLVSAKAHGRQFPKG